VKVFVSGGAGFIGSHLCEALLTAGHEVICVDNFITGSRRNIAVLQDQPSFQLIEADIVEPLNVPCDIVCHLASPASPVSYRRYAVETMLVNAAGTFQLLNLAHKHRARFLLASTSEVYGNPQEHPQKETYWGRVNPIGPRSCYDEGKRYAEALTVNFSQRYELDFRIVRIFNTYGPHSDPADGRIIPNFVTQALRAQPITVYGDGSQTRSYCYVSDLVEGIMKILMIEKARGEVINLGNPDERSALEIAHLVKELTGSRSIIVHTAPRPEEIDRRVPDISKARKLLGWKPKVSLEEGLARTIEDFKEMQL